MIDFDLFTHWAEERFPGQVVVKGNEVRINSIFADDHKFHLWCSPGGGKHLREDGCYRCFKTDKRGTLLGLVMLVDNCSYGEAKETLNCGGIPLHELEKQLDEILDQPVREEKPLSKVITLPPETYLIDDLPGINRSRQEAERYLRKRKLPTEKMYFCVSGDYRNRIIIPYYDAYGNLIYFNGRHIGKSTLRYFGPPKEIGVGKGDVLFMPHWPQHGSKIYVTEGEFDSISLYICGFNSAACGGKFLTDKQVEMLRPYRICLALDADSSGLQAVIDMGDKLISRGIKSVTYVRPPDEVKDWNKLLQDYNENIVKHYVEKFEKPYDDWTGQDLIFNRL
jgi:hypothetical protein